MMSFMICTPCKIFYVCRMGVWHAGERGAYKITCKKLSVWWIILKSTIKEEDLFCMCVAE